MTKSQKINQLFQDLLQISYENEHGGAYAYMKFLASSRMLLQVLKPYPAFEKQANQLESINWLFNEYLAVRFTYAHKVIFENKQFELRDMYHVMAEQLKVHILVQEESFVKHYAHAA
jgi:hypothetical protein